MVFISLQEYHPNIWHKIDDDVFELVKKTNYDGDAQNVDEEGFEIFLCTECEAPTQYGELCKHCDEVSPSPSLLIFGSTPYIFGSTPCIFVSVI